jgi:hypothetical protein
MSRGGSTQGVRIGSPELANRRDGMIRGDHVGQIVDVLVRQHADAVGPWRAFLGILER